MTKKMRHLLLMLKVFHLVNLPLCFVNLRLNCSILKAFPDSLAKPTIRASSLGQLLESLPTYPSPQGSSNGASVHNKQTYLFNS